MARGAAKREERSSGIVPSDEVLLSVETTLRRQFEQLHGLYALVEALVRVDKLDDVYAVALDALERTIHPDRASVLLLDRDGVMLFKAWRGLSDAYRAAVEGHSPWSPDEPTPLPITVDDVHDDPTLACFGELFAREGIGALAFVPMVCGGRLLGKFMLYYDAPHVFGREELRLAEAIAHHVAFAVSRRRSEEELHLYREMFHHSIDGIAVIDSAGRYLEHNPAHQAMIGYSLDELRGRTPEVHLGEAAFARIAEELAAQGSCRVHVTSQPKVGEPRAIDIAAFAVPDAAGGEVRYVGIKRDVSEREAAHRRSEELALELRRALDARQEFLSIASHELKTPITALTLQLDAILRAAQRGDDTLPREWVVDRFGGARRQVVRLVQLVDSLLDLSRIDAGRFRLNLDAVDFVAVFRESVERFRDELARAKCPLILRARGSIHGVSDAQRVDQVVTNLLSNAVKYGHGAPVEATIEAVGDRLRFSVRDEGIGIAEGDQGRVFERFERAVSDRRYGGFGLGLFIAREIVRALGGEISVVSAPGRGSLFTVELPRESRPSPTA